MFNKLISSERKRRGLFGAGSMSVSVVLHLLLLAGAVYASVGAAEEEKQVEEEVTFMEIEEKAPEPPAAEEPPPPPPPQDAPATPPPPKGFQELVPPVEPPPVIPEVDQSAPAVSADDFSGVGVAGGTSTGIEGGTPQNTAGIDSSQVVFEAGSLEYDDRPEIRNRAQLGGILNRLYPRMLADAGIAGQTVLRFVILPDGKVDAGTIQVVSTSHEQFSDASVKAVERFRFKPGRYKGEPVRVMIEIPISWKPDR